MTKDGSAKASHRRPGPPPERVRIEGMDWQEALDRALRRRRPPEGWPAEDGPAEEREEG